MIWVVSSVLAKPSCSFQKHPISEVGFGVFPHHGDMFKITCRLMCRTTHPWPKGETCQDGLYSQFLIQSKILWHWRLPVLCPEILGHFVGDFNCVLKTLEHLSTVSDLLICCWASSDRGKPPVLKCWLAAFVFINKILFKPLLHDYSMKILKNIGPWFLAGVLKD